MIKVAYVEDDPNFRKFISDFLNNSPEIEFINSFGSVEDLLTEARQIKEPDILLLDISLPGMTGLEGIRLIKSAFPKMEIIMFTIHDDSDRIFQALCSGASGFLLKNTPLPKMKEHLKLVYRGEAAMSPSIARKVIRFFKPKEAAKEDLSARELQIIDAIVQGLSYKLIADKFFVSINTVRFHIKNIYRKLDVNSKMEIVAKKMKGEI